MPKGVEHSYQFFSSGQAICVINSVMPKGVEHNPVTLSIELSNQ